MKIKISDLRRIIRETLSELHQDSVPPGRWTAHTVEPAKAPDLERLVLGKEDEDEEDDEESR